MSFSDDDLARLKELLDDPQASGFFTEEMARRILARLEAAETLIKAMAPHFDTDEMRMYQAWKEAAGKDVDRV